MIQGPLGAALPVRRYTHSSNVDEPLQLEAFDSRGAFTARYTYHGDHLGSIRFLTDAAGTVVNAYDYDSYGRPQLEITAIAQPFQYTGREWDDAAQLYHYRARNYDPTTGRFIQEDPIGFAAGDLNIYRYVLSNPLIYTDPMGLAAASGDVKTRKMALMNGASSGTMAARVGCAFGNLAGVVDLGAQIVAGNVVGAAITSASSFGSCGGGKVGIAVSRQAKEATELVLSTQAKMFTLRKNGDILSDIVKNGSLNNVIKSLFRSKSTVGNGSSQAAAVYTKLTGQLVGGSDHKKKVFETISRLKDIIHNEKLGVMDLAVARTLLKDLQKSAAIIK